MDSLLIWTIAIVLIAAVFVPYLISFTRSRRKAEARKQEATALGIDRPRAQFPMVNRSLCIGCGSCVEACPEGDVLGVVWGVAEVINGERCVGHGYCELACPVMALKVGLGDLRSRPDIPVLSDEYESSKSNLFIAGELSGLSLIRHAIAQGTAAVEAIARRATGDQHLLIIGAGPAGLSAALMARKLGLRYTVLDQYDVGGTILHYPRRKLVMTQAVEIPLAGKLESREYSKEELLDMWQAIAAKERLNIQTGCKVAGVSSIENGFKATIETGETYSADFMLLALGRRGSPRRLGVEGEDLPKVMYQLVDAQSYQQKNILVVGGGDSAVEAAIGLARQPGNRVVLSYRKTKLFRIKKKNEERIEEQIKKGTIAPYFESNVLRIDTGSVVLETPAGEMELPNDYVIIQAGGIPPFKMLKEVGIAFGGESISLAEKDRRSTQTSA